MIDIERIRDELKRNPEPSGPCHVCGARDWWYRLPRLIYNTIPSPGGWVCGRCHPMPGAIPVGDDVRDGSMSCRFIPDNSILASNPAPVRTINPEPADKPAEEPAPEPEPEKPADAPARRTGRPALSIDPHLICDTLRTAKNVKLAADTLGCSRGYIYKVVGAEKVKELIEWQ